MADTFEALTFSQPCTTSATEFLSLKSSPLPSLGPNQVLIKLLAAPINPLDLVILADKYPVKPTSSVCGASIPGSDGIGEVLESTDPSLQAGDYVLPRSHGFGTWRTHAVVPASSVLAIHGLTDPVVGAILKTSVAAAYFLIEDVRALRPGDWIAVNAATSAIGQLVVQFARLRGVHCVAVVRDRAPEELAEKKAHLRGLGADAVVCASELAAGVMPELELAGKRVVLGIDAMSGSCGNDLLNLLSPEATYVALGYLAGNGRGVVHVTEKNFFFKQIDVRGFRLSKCLAKRSEGEQRDLFEWLAGLFREGRLKVPDLRVTEWRSGSEGLERRLVEAVDRAQRKDVGKKKQLLVFK